MENIDGFIVLVNTLLNSDNIESVQLFSEKPQIVEGVYSINEEGEILVLDKNNRVDFRLPAICISVELFKKYCDNFRGIKCIQSENDSVALSMSLDTYLRAISNRNAVSYARSKLLNLIGTQHETNNLCNIHLRFICKQSFIDEGFLTYLGMIKEELTNIRKVNRFLWHYLRHDTSIAKVCFSSSKKRIGSIKYTDYACCGYKNDQGETIKIWDKEIKLVLPHDIYNKPYSKMLAKAIKQFLNINKVSQDTGFFIRKRWMITKVWEGLLEVIADTNTTMFYQISCVKSAYAVLSLLYKEACAEDEVIKCDGVDIRGEGLLMQPKYNDSVDYIDNMKIFAEYVISNIRATSMVYKLELNPEEESIMESISGGEL